MGIAWLNAVSECGIRIVDKHGAISCNPKKRGIPYVSEFQQKE
jgi:hypothetical protein